MADPVPALFGTAGIVAGETWVLPRGQEISIGRSRSCAVSLRRASKYIAAAGESRDDDHDFNTVSRCHVKLTVAADGSASIEDLSSNGTLLAGQALAGPATVDLRNGPVELRLGTRETLTLELLSPDDSRIAGKSPVSVDPSPNTSAEAGLESNTLRPS